MVAWDAAVRTAMGVHVLALCTLASIFLVPLEGPHLQDPLCSVWPGASLHRLLCSLIK